MSEIQGSSVLIVGYGREGRATHRFLLARYPQLQVAVADQHEVALIPESAHDTPCFTGPDYLQRVREFSTVIHSPGVDMTQLLGAEELAALHLTTPTNLFFSLCPGKVIGVTGTKGKSTTTSLITALLKTTYPDVRMGGNIGTPMLDCLAGTTADSIFVVELSSFQLRDIAYSPHVAVLLNIVPEHLDRHGSFEAYAAAKARITKFQTPDDVLMYNPDFELLDRITSPSAARRVLFSARARAQALCRLEHGVITSAHGTLAALDELALRGEGNAQNVLAAACCALHFSTPASRIQTALRAFTPLEHRLEPAGELRGIRFVNDSLSTIPEALGNALSAFPGQVDTLIAGGFDRGLDQQSAGAAIIAHGVRNLILFPATGEKIWSAVADRSETHAMRYFPVQSMEDAVRIAYERTAPGKVCLLSPAAPSFNLFRDYRERGEKFKDLVRLFGGRRKIVCAINSLRGGGAERILTLLASAWAQQHEVTVMPFDRGRSTYTLSPKVRLTPLNINLKGKPFLDKCARLVRLVRVLRRTLAHMHPDLVVSFMDQANILTLLCAPKNIPVLACERVNPEYGSLAEKSARLRPALLAGRNMLYRRAHRVVVQTEGAKRYFTDRGMTHVEVIPNPVIVPSTVQADLSLPPHCIVTLGRLVPQKRIDLLLRAFARLAPKYMTWHLAIVGEGPLAEELAILAQSLGIAGRVRFTGPTRTPHALLCHAQIFVLCSDYEGFPGALCEAMSMGLPVIATDCPYGPSEIIRHGVDGVLVPPGDSAALSAAIENLINDPATRARLGEEAHKVTERFSAERINARWQEIFKQA